MEQIIKSLLEKTPDCLTGFKVSVSDIKLPRSWNTGLLFTTKQLSCKCGNQELELNTNQQVRVSGFFKKREKTELFPPVKVSCPNCGYAATIFDPQIHGWNGQIEDHSCESENSNLSPHPESPAKVFANYSYQGVENYEGLIADGVANPEDYFDTFTVLIVEPKTGNVVEVLSSECA
ncbi:hypothetical protein GCM10008090_10180 [Arenicella chitinivorans]|uniref:Uncharacterized protein n=1 Tax=Arenicella chitinivorans TaxID=1329800 RepID=A0A918VJ64_9GAMM|nr:hypothetical protein [Arenicella chitinivorans]GHA03170.1 hypothetical protein GCM10008090_10180 [Arenicella chitinivorans]